MCGVTGSASPRRPRSPSRTCFLSRTPERAARWSPGFEPQGGGRGFLTCGPRRPVYAENPRAPGWLSWLSVCLWLRYDARVLGLSTMWGLRLSGEPASPSPSAYSSPCLCSLSFSLETSLVFSAGRSSCGSRPQGKSPPSRSEIRASLQTGYPGNRHSGAWLPSPGLPHNEGQGLPQ